MHRSLGTHELDTHRTEWHANHSPNPSVLLIQSAKLLYFQHRMRKAIKGTAAALLVRTYTSRKSTWVKQLLVESIHLYDH